MYIHFKGCKKMIEMLIGTGVGALVPDKEDVQPGDWYFHEGEWYYCTVDHVELRSICSPFLDDTDPNQIRTVNRSGQSHDIPLNNIDTRYVTNMGYMFYQATNFNQDISNWDTSNVTDMQWMFSYATNFNQDISNWNVSNVTSMQWMFREASNFNQDISKWDTSNVTDMSRMFNYATSFNQDLSKWCVTNIKTKPNLFDDGSKLTTGNLPRWGTCPNG